MKHPQFTLDLSRPVDVSRSAFARAPANEEALRLIEQWPDWPGPAVCIAGPAHSGKSHLACIWAERAGARHIDLAALDTAFLESRFDGPLWIDRHTEQPFDEKALFHALNLAREEGRSILLTAAAPPANWKVTLPDLASRLRAVPVTLVGAPDDGLLEAILIKRFADIGVDADEAVLRYLLARIERSYGAAAAVVAGFDRLTLASHRRASVPLAAQVLESLETSE